MDIVNVSETLLYLGEKGDYYKLLGLDQTNWSSVSQELFWKKRMRWVEFFGG